MLALRTQAEIIAPMNPQKTSEDLRAFLTEETKNSFWPTITRNHLVWFEPFKSLAEDLVAGSFKKTKSFLREYVFCVRLMRASGFPMPANKLEPIKDTCVFKHAINGWASLPGQTWLEAAVFDHKFDHFPTTDPKINKRNVGDALKHYLRIPSIVFEKGSAHFDISNETEECILEHVSSLGSCFEISPKFCETICNILKSGKNEIKFVVKVLRAIDGKVCWKGTNISNLEMEAFNALKISKDAAADFYALVGLAIQSPKFHMSVANSLFIDREPTSSHAKLIEICLKFIEAPIEDIECFRHIMKRNKTLFHQGCDARDSGVLLDLIAVISKLKDLDEEDDQDDIFSWSCLAVLAWAPTMQNHIKHGKFIKTAFNGRVVESLIVSFEKEHPLTQTEMFKTSLKQFIRCCTFGAEEAQNLLKNAPKELMSAFDTDQFPSADYVNALIGVKRKIRTEDGLMEVCHKYICSEINNGLCPSCKIMRKLMIIWPCRDYICEECSTKKMCSTCNQPVRDVAEIKQFPRFDDQTLAVMKAFV